MPQIALASWVRVNEGRADELITAFSPVFELVASEPGTLLYALHQSSENSNLFFVYELYEDEEAFRAHAESPAMAQATPALAAVIAQSDLVTGRPLRADGLPKPPPR